MKKVNKHVISEFRVIPPNSVVVFNTSQVKKLHKHLQNAASFFNERNIIGIVLDPETTLYTLNDEALSVMGLQRVVRTTVQ